jgi:hypothetical protein
VGIQLATKVLELEHAQRGHDLASGHAGARDQIVDGGRLVVEAVQERSFRVGKRQLGRMPDGGRTNLGDYRRIGSLRLAI